MPQRIGGAYPARREPSETEAARIEAIDLAYPSSHKFPDQPVFVRLDCGQFERAIIDIAVNARDAI
jgi:hypothetical protein